MVNDISHKEFCRVLNHTIEKWGALYDGALDSEINVLFNKFDTRRSSNPQIDIFEETVVSAENMQSLKKFGVGLEYYKDCLIHDDDIPEEAYRQLLNDLNTLSPYIEDKNKTVEDILRRNLQGHLPEYRETLLLESYNQEMNRIMDMKRGYLRNRRKNQPASKEYEIKAMQFMQILKTKEQIETFCNITPCAEKIKVYQNILSIIDCLPSCKYGRIAKFTLKRDINKYLKIDAEKLGSGYEEIKEKATYEEKRYQNAIDKTLSFTKKEARKRAISIEKRNKMAMEEWLYK